MVLAMRLVRVFPTLALGVTLGCASGNGGSLTPRSGLQTVTTDRGDVRVQVDQSPRVEVLSPPASVLFTPLVEAHRRLEIQPDLIDPATGTVGWTSATWVREFQGVPLSTYLDCGRSGTGGPAANESRVAADFRTVLVPLPAGGTEVRTWLSAIALPMDGSSRGSVRCSSMKVLERQLAIELTRAYQATLDGELAAPASAAAPPPPPASTPALDHARAVFGAVEASGVEAGDRIRIVDRYDQRITGTMGLLLPEEFTMNIVGRTSGMPWQDLQAFERRVERPSKALWGGLLGVVVGGVVGHASNFGITGRHGETQGKILGPGLGAVTGGLVGAWLGSRVGGGYWITVPLPTPRR